VSLKALSYGFCKRVYLHVGPTRTVFLIQLTTWRDAETTVLWGRTQNEPCTPECPAHIRCVVCGTAI